MNLQQRKEGAFEDVQKELLITKTKHFVIDINEFKNSF